MRKVIVGIVLTLVLLTPTKVSAVRHEERLQDVEERRAELQQNLEQRRQERLQMLQDIRQRVQDKKATLAARLQEHRKERIRSFWQRLNRRILATIGRLEQLIARIESRIAKIEETGEDVDTSDIHKQLEEAKEMLDAARQKKLAADDTLEDVLASNDPKTAFGVVREAIQEIKNDLVEVHRILVHVIGDIRGLRVGATDGEGEDGEDEEPTPTVQPTEQPTETPTEAPTPTVVE